MWLSLLMVLALVAGLALASSTGAQGPTCTPNADGACGSADVNLTPGGQQRGDLTQIKNGDASASIDFSVNCSYPADYIPPFHDWGVGVGVYREGKLVSGNSAAFGGGESADTNGADSNPNDLANPLPVGLPMDPQGPPKQTFDVKVILQCNGMTTTIDDKTFTICRGATATSQAGLDAIKEIEKLKRDEYDNDGAKHKSGPFKGQGNCTIGWGHLIHEGDCVCKGAATCTAPDNSTKEVTKLFDSEQPFYKKGIDEKQAQKLFDEDIRTAEELFRPQSALPFNQCQLNALTDFFFNVGRQGRYSAANKGGPLRGNTQLAVDLDNGDYAGVPAQILTQPGNHARREADAAMFSGPCAGC